MIDKYQLRKDIWRVCFFIIVAVLVLIYVSPFLVMFFTSFKTNSDAFTIPVRLFPRKWVSENYPAAMSAIPYFRYMGNTIYITVLSVIGQLIVTPMVAYSLSKINWKGSKIISGLLMATMMIPISVTMVPLYRIYSKIGLTNTYVPLILPAFLGKAFYIIITRQFFMGIPNSLIEAAKIDGANGVQTFFKITLPMLSPILKVVLMLAITGAFKDYEAIMVLTQGGPGNRSMVMFLYIYNMIFGSGLTNMTQPQIGYGALLSVVAAIIVGIVTIAYQRIARKLDDVM